MPAAIANPECSSTTTRRRIPAVVAMVAALVFALVVTSCTGAVRDPTKYGDVNAKGEGFYGNLMYGCTGVLPDDEGNYVGDDLIASADYCRCLFEGLKNKVPFDDVREFETAQAEAEAGQAPAVPKAIAEVQDACSEEFPAEGAA